jgi:hypothetical protein
MQGGIARSVDKGEKKSYTNNIDDGSGNADRSEVGEVLDLSPEDLRFFLSLI